MAYIEKTAFEARITNKQNNDLDNIAGLFVNGNGDAEVCSAGFLCKRSELTESVGYPAGVENENTDKMVAAVAGDKADEEIYACNTYDVRLISDGTNAWAVGRNVLGIPAPAGREVTFTKIDFQGDRKYRFGIGNVNGTVGSNCFATIADGLFVPAAAAPTTAGAVYFKILREGNFTEGNRASFGYVDVEAHRVFA